MSTLPWLLISFKDVFLQIFIDFFSQNEERFHKYEVFHNLLSIVFVLVESISMDIICTRKFSTFFPIDQDIVDFQKRVKLYLGRGVIEGVDDHPLADKQVASNGHGGRQHNIGDNADKEAISKRVGHILLKESHVILIIGPLPEVVEGSVKEAVHDDQDYWKICFVEESDDDQEQIHGCIVDHLKDEGLDKVTHFYKDVVLMPFIQFRHGVGVLLGLPDDDFHCLFSHIHVVKDQVAVSEKQGKDCEYPSQDNESHPPYYDGQQGRDQSCLHQRPQKSLLQVQAFLKDAFCSAISVEENVRDPSQRNRVCKTDEKKSNRCVQL